MKRFITLAASGILASIFAAHVSRGDTPAAPAPPEVGGTPTPQMQAVLDELDALGPKPLDVLDAKQARRQPSAADAVIKLLKKQDKTTNQEPVADETDRKIGDGNGSIPIRVYTPGGDGPFPVIVYFHGGGFVIATIDTYESSCRALANGAQAIVVSVEYRKAPEDKFPAALDDASAAYTWVTRNIANYKGDPKRIAIAGESAGGNLATEVCIRLAEKGMAEPAYELLVYPVTNNNLDTESYQVNANAKPLNRAMMSWFFAQYLDTQSSGNDPHVSPIKADNSVLAKLPPTMIITAAIDPLHDDGKMYADKLRSAGVQVTYKNYPGVTHEFFGMGAVVDTAKQAEDDASAQLKQAFGT